MLNKVYVSIHTITYPDEAKTNAPRVHTLPSSRAMRLVDDTKRFLLVSIRKNVRDDELRDTMVRWTRDGITLGSVWSEEASC